MGFIKVDKITALELLNLQKGRKLPSFKRYTWNGKSSQQVVEDISKELNKSSYSLGEIVYVKENLIDGASRLITLSLIAKSLGFEYPEIERRWSVEEVRKLKESYDAIKRALSFVDIAEFRRFFSTSLFITVIELEKLEDSFSFFDDGIERGVVLDPSDILKAYHLCSMRAKSEGEKLEACAKWESIGRDRLSLLLRIWHPIYYWRKSLPAPPFSMKELSSFEGISEDEDYPYLKRMKSFELYSTIVNGQNFFNRCFYYERLLENLLALISSRFPSLMSAVDFSLPSESSCFDLFLSLSLLMLDRFGREWAVKSLPVLFKYSFSLRLEDSSVSIDKINKHILARDSIFPVILYSSVPYDVYTYDLSTKLGDMRNIALRGAKPVRAIDFSEDFKRWINE